GERAEGVVTDVVPRRRAYRPVVRFVARDSQEVEFRCRHGVQRDTYAVGQSVPVYYLASDPTFAVVASRQSLWQPLAFAPALFLLPLVGGGVLVYRESAGRRDRGNDRSRETPGRCPPDHGQGEQGTFPSRSDA